MDLEYVISEAIYMLKLMLLAIYSLLGNKSLVILEMSISDLL